MFQMQNEVHLTATKSHWSDVLNMCECVDFLTYLLFDQENVSFIKEPINIENHQILMTSNHLSLFNYYFNPGGTQIRTQYRTRYNSVPICIFRDNTQHIQTQFQFNVTILFNCRDKIVFTLSHF